MTYQTVRAGKGVLLRVIAKGREPCEGGTTSLNLTRAQAKQLIEDIEAAL